jgi:hypothetical protein
MKRKLLVTFILVLFLVPAVMAAESFKFVTAKAAPTTTEDVLVVPVDVTNAQDLVALDIPLSFSEGATLDQVVFTDRVKSFEVKIANIDNEKRNVVLGLISMVTGEKPDMAAGSGAIAELHFKLEPGVKSVEINPITIEHPNHSLTYYYNDYSSGRPEVVSVHPEVEAGQVFYSNPTAIPTNFALHQNSPNPFNPTTRIAFDMPTAGDVRISVFNVLGQHVTDLVDGYRDAGSYEVVWDGKDNSGACFDFVAQSKKHIEAPRENEGLRFYTHLLRINNNRNILYRPRIAEYAPDFVAFPVFARKRLWYNGKNYYFNNSDGTLFV